MILFPAKVSLKFVVISPLTTIVALDTFLIFFFMRITGVIAMPITPMPIKASFQELKSNTNTRATNSKIASIKLLSVLIRFLEAVSGSVKNLLSTIPEELTSKNLVSIEVSFLNKSTFKAFDILLPVQSER